MTFSFADFSAALKAGAPVSAEDVLALRRQVWPDGNVSDAEATSLFELNRLVRDPTPEWAAFFVEAITDYLVNSRKPRGYIDDSGAAWLIDQIGAPVGALELELVVKLLESALNAPASLKSFALRQIESAVLSGEGATRETGPVRPRMIDEDEVTLLRRIIFAPGGDGALVVSQEEAEMLWRLKDACLGAANAQGWKALFVQAVGNHLMAFSSYRPLERGEAERLEAFVADHRASVLGFLGRMRATRPTETVDIVRTALSGEAPVDHDAAVDAARAITSDEDSWLQGRIDADGTRDELEEALLAFIAEETKEG